MKNQIKKSFSLFLAVIMLMSCWVWVAPEKASAATSGYYPLKIVWDVKDQANGGSATVNVTYKTNNGTGTSTTKSYSMSDLTSKTGSVTWSDEVPGFPTSIYIKIDNGGMRQFEMVMKSISISGKTLGTGDWTFKSTWGSAEKTFNQSGGGDWGSVTPDWPNPKISEASASLSSDTLTLTKLGTSTTQSTTLTVSGLKDQYGVNWIASADVSFSLTAGEGITLGTKATITDNGSNATIKVTPAFQELFKNVGSARLTASWNVNNNTKFGNETITVNFPTYDITFDANGGLIGSNENTGADTVSVSGKKYGEIIGTSPAYRSKAGFEFDGFYTNENADATGLTASFLGTKFQDSITEVGTQGDITYYAAWKAKPITATFMSADNQLIGTVEGRYNNTLINTNMYNGLNGLNAAVKAAYNGTSISFDGNNAPVYKDGSSTYTFSHWKIIEGYDNAIVDKDHTATLKGDVTFQAVYTKADAKKYAVKFYDGNGNVINDASNKSDYKFRDSVIMPATEPSKAQGDKYAYEFIGWANKLEGVDFFAVDEADKDESGAVISYTSKDAAEFTVRGDASYVPVFRMIPREYNVTFNYKVDGGNTESVTVGGYHLDDAIEMPEGMKDNYTAGGYRYYIDGWKVGTDNKKQQLADIKVTGDLSLTATYGAGQGAEYTINFYGKAADGVTDVLLNGDNNIYQHNSTVTVPDVEQKISTEDSLYTFDGWLPEVSTTAKADAEYYAQYTKKDYADVYFYNYDGTLIYKLDGKENSLFVGETIPEYKNLVEGEDGTTTNVLPSKPEDPTGTYNFTGWADSEGKAVVPGTDNFTGDIHLTAQFETVYKNYTVKFLNEDGTVVSEKTYHYATEIEIPANPTKDADETFSYEFRGWTPDVSEVCYGDATYTATYRRAYNYYEVTWFEGINNGTPVVLTTSKYKYDAKIMAAVVDLGGENPIGYGNPADGYKWAFKHWVQCDENGNAILVDGKQVIFVRGQMKMGTEHLYFYPVFEEVANPITVTFYEEDGTTEIGKTEIPYNGKIAEYLGDFEIKAAKAPTAEKHFVLTGWTLIDSVADENGDYPLVETITKSVSVKPVYAEGEHTFNDYVVSKYPTCTEEGIADKICTTDGCTYTAEDQKIPVLADIDKPSGQIYVGSDLWKSTDSVDFDDVKFIGPDTKLVVNAFDNGTRSMPWNVDGEISRGVGTISYYVAEGEVDATTIMSGWTEVYNYEAKKAEVLSEVLTSKGLLKADYDALEETKKAAIDSEVNAILATYKANATGLVSNLELEDGKSYVIYIKVTDREVDGKSNVTYFSSGKLYYDTKTPEITVSGEGYGTKFCAEANIRISDNSDKFDIYLDGELVKAYESNGTTSASGAFVTSYKTTEPGVHTVTVIDKNGNKSSKLFEIKGSHTYRNYTVSATCEKDGSRYDLCIVCGVEANKEVLKKLGHSYTLNYTDKQATCLEDGSRTYTCDNNCGTKITVKPTSAEGKLDEAVKWDATAGENGEWVALTEDDIDYLKAVDAAADLKALKSTGEHTYAKVKDEDGNDTAEDAWVIDKAATCIVEGSKHKDCTVCGILGRVTEAIEVDTENGHKFYRATVTKAATCTEKGEKTKTCRYCGTEEIVEYIDALGHTAGEYEVLTAATCEAAGSKVLKCGRCEVKIGEADAEGNYNLEAPVAVEIPALGHAYKTDGVVYEKDGEYYHKYVCANDSTHVEEREAEGYVPPVAATVTFDFSSNGGYYVIPAVGNENEFGYVPPMMKGTQKVSAFVGESISADEVETALKQNDATKIYTFSHWADAEGNAVKFPIEVKGDATYYAVYAEKYINYTITYYTETVTAEGGIEYNEYKKTGYIHNGEEVTLADGPSKAGDWKHTYKFAGWKVMNGDTVYTDKVTINAASINLVATYTPVLKVYGVTYAYKGEVLESFTVDAGDKAADCKIMPEKEYDSKYHYEFNGWNKASQLVEVSSNIYTTPDFKAVEHVYKEDITQTAKCGVNEITTYTCECGHTYKKVTNPALAHDLVDTNEVNPENGKKIVKCQREGCDFTQEDTRNFTVEFYINEADTQPIKTSSYIPYGSILAESKIPAAPTKDKDSTYTYEFLGWALKGTTDLVEFDEFTIVNDCQFVAVFKATKRTYNVIFRYDGGTVIETFKDVEAGSGITTSFTDAQTPVQAYSENYHYEFSGWKGYEKGKLNITVEDVQSEIHVIAEFEKIEHSYTKTTLDSADCTHGEGIRYICSCGHYYDVTGKPLPHEYEVIERVEATPDKNGYVVYKCKTCDETYREELIYDDNKITISVYVTLNGAAKSGIQVEIQPLGGGAPIFATTNANGVATKEVDEDSVYVCWVVIDGEKIEIALESADNKGNLVGYYNYEIVEECTCACHRDNIWGAIFRFFHKIIKLFTGEFNCCTDPDPMYG